MSQRKHTPARTLSQRPHLDQLRRQAKELLEAYSRGDADAAVEIDSHYHGADPTTFALHDAQLVIARAYGFQSWPKLKAVIDGVTVRRLASAIRDGDLEGVRTMLAARPELVNVDQAENDEHKLLLELGLDPDETRRVGGLDEEVSTWGGPLREAVIAGHRDLVEILLAHGANPNTNVYAASSALFEAHKRGDEQTKQLLEQRGARFGPSFVGERGLADQAAQLLAAETVAGASAVARELIWGALGSPSPEIVRLALPHIKWPRDDGQWHGLLENGLYLGAESERVRHLKAFRLVLERCDPDVRSPRGTTLLHEVTAARGGLTADDRIVYATVLLDAGARLDVRDELLESTPLGWACRWGRIELVRLFIARGADPVEADARPWASPAAWARKKQRDDALAELRKHGAVDQS